jgi:DNA-binding Lrp family transcriptional regulator
MSIKASSEPVSPVHPSTPRRPLDDIDRRLLAVLGVDGRISVNELATKANVSRATAYARFDRLRADGVITGFRAEVDPAALGYSIAALILVNVDQGQWRVVLDELAKLPGVEYVALTSGGFDFALLVRVPDVAALRDVVLVRLQGMPAVRSTQTIFVLDENRRPLGAIEFA